MRSRAEAGDLDGALTLAVERYGDEVYGFLCGLAGDVDRAGDAFGATCERMFGALPAFRWDCPLRAWMYQIARNEFLRAAERERRLVPLSKAPALQDAVTRIRSATPAYQRTDVKDAFAALREQLPPDDRVLLGLRLDRDLSWNEIATILEDANPAALRKRFERLKAKLAELAAELVPEDE